VPSVLSSFSGRDLLISIERQSRKIKVIIPVSFFSLRMDEEKATKIMARSSVTGILEEFLEV